MGRAELLVVLGARTATDRRGPWVYGTSLRSVGPPALAIRYRQRWRAEQVIEELLNGHDLDHLVSTRFHPNHVAIGFRLLARNLAIGRQIAETGMRPAIIREPRAGRTAPVDGLGIFHTFHTERRTIVIPPLQPWPAGRLRLPWTRQVVRYAA